MSTAKFNQWLNSDGTENYKCRAWVNFNGTGTVAIRAAGNVSSITDNGVGLYTVNFTNAMPDASYASILTNGTAFGPALCEAYDARTTTTQQITSKNSSTNANADAAAVNAAFFR